MKSNLLILNRRRQAGFSLVEVTLALGIAAFTLLAVFGLLPIGMNASNTSSEQTRAADIATAVITDLREATTSGTSPRYSIPLASGSTVLFFTEAQGGQLTVGNNSRYRAVIVRNPLPQGGKTATVGSVTISWPVGNGSASVVPLGSFKAPFAFDRNFQ